MIGSIAVRSIRARLTLWYMLLLSATLLVLGGSVYGLLLYSQRHDFDVALQSIARNLERQSRNQSHFLPPDVEALFRSFFGPLRWGHFFQMRDPQGHRYPRRQKGLGNELPLSQMARDNAIAGRFTFETVHGLGDYPIRVLTRPVMEQGRVVHLVQVGMSLESLYATRRRFLLIVTAVLPLGILCAGTGGCLLAKRALAPVHQMTETARRFGAEQLGERLAQSGAGDELDRLAATLNDMLDRLHEAFRQMRQFSADASHELQTPLTILKGELEVALRVPRDVEGYQQRLQSALEEVDRIAFLVDGLLLLSRVDAGVLRMDKRPLDLTHLLLDVYEQTQILASRHGVALDIEQMDHVVVAGDRERLQRLLLNLIDNAIKYTPAGGRIALSLTAHGAARVSVVDTGIGMHKVDLPHIFNRFYRSSEARELGVGGSGLGLCIAQSIAEAHGGHLDVASAAGHGSTFTLCLPLST